MIKCLSFQPSEGFLYFCNIKCLYINPFKPNEISHSYRLDQSISVLRVVWSYLSFLFNKNKIKHSVCKHSAASDLGLYCLPMSHKKDARLISRVSDQNI